MDKAGALQRVLRRPATLSQALMLSVFIGLLPLLIASFLQASASWRDTQALADAQLAATARTVAERMRDPFIIARHSLMTVSALSEVRDITSGCDAGLAAGRTTDPTFNNFVRADASGTVRCSLLPFARGTTLSNDRWWREGVARGGFSITQPVIGRVAKQPVIIAMLATTGPDGTPDGSVSAGVTIASIRNSVVQDPAGETGYIAILDHNGRTFAANRPVMFERISAAAKTGVAEAKDGSSWSYALAPIYSGELQVLYAEPQRQIMSAALSNIRYSIFIPLLAIMFACGAIWMGSDYFVLRWLRKLRSAASRFAHGDYSSEREDFTGAPQEVRDAGNDLYAMAGAIRARDADITASLSAQKQLTREIHHRVKNNLQIVTSLLTLQAGRLKETSAREALGQTRARVSALGLIYRLLYDQGTDPELGQVALHALVPELCAQLRSGHGSQPHINLQCATTQHAISIDQAVPLTLFIVEAVTNAYRHAFPGEKAGSITVTITDRDGKTDLEIRDTGVGYDVEEIRGQMGFELMQAFAVQLEGELSVAGSEPHGTIVRVSFRPAA